MKVAFIDSTQIHSYNDNSLGFVISPMIKGLESPEIRLPSFVKPNFDGAVVPNHLYGGRLITLTGLIFADNISTYRQRRRDFERAVAIKRDSTGKAQPLIVKFTTDDDIELQVEAYLKGIDFPDEDLMSGRFKIDLYVPSLYLLSQTLKNTDVFIFQGGGFTIPFTIPFAMNVAGSSLSTITNDGNVEAYPFYILRGPLEDPTFTNVSTGEQFSLNYTLVSGETIEIDTVKGTVVYKASATASPVNIRQYFTGTFVTIAEGVNQVKFSNAVSSNTGLISVQFRDSFTGV